MAERQQGPGWRPRLVALDIDGTLLIPRWLEESGVEAPTDVVRDAVLRAREAGAHVVLASGRGPLSMAGVADQLDLAARLPERLYVVASNGSVIFRHPGLEVVHEETFDASEAVRRVLEYLPDAAVAVEEHGVGYRVNRRFPPGELDGDMILTDVDDLVAQDVSRVIIRDPESSPDEFVRISSKLGLQGTNYFIGWTAWLDLAPAGVTKASGLEWVCAELGVRREDVLAIGDGRNDADMLRWAGRGVAMGQAIPEVRAAADDVTGSVEEDGAAAELGRWFG